jgi:hypothetical protein
MNAKDMIQIKSKTVAHSTPDFSSNAVTLSSVLPKIIFTRNLRISSDGSCMWSSKLPNCVQPSTSVYRGHYIVDWKIGKATIHCNGAEVVSPPVMLAPSFTTDSAFM